ncbi:hypothetical protein [Bordetella petrii]|uniref:hypothetical protein n=1 Tax=Bordetella petrii TaxID=94624 RepID=UPI00048BADD9|nr:hypothetical protein [Bordetella petrii]
MTYLLENINTAIAKIAECMARDPKRAERLLGDVKKWSGEAEREAYVRGKAAGLEAAAKACEARLGQCAPGMTKEDVEEPDAEAQECADAIRALIPEN